MQDGKVKSVAGSEVSLAVSAKKTAEVTFGSGPGGLSNQPVQTSVHSWVMPLLERVGVFVLFCSTLL